MSKKKDIPKELRNRSIDTRWKKGQSGNPNGRPKKLFKTMAVELSDQGYQKVSQAQITEAIEMILALPKSELQRILDDESQPIMFKVIIKALVGAKGMEALDRLLDRVHGKPKQTTNFGAEEGKNVRFVLEVQGEDGK